MNDLIPLEGATVPEVVFESEPTDPKERAEHRLKRLATSFAEVLGTIAQMYKDEDWKYVTRADGSEFTSLADLLREHMSVSVAMARRYIQGARDIYLPLQELVVQGTPIQITAGDVATLGLDGSRSVVSTVAERVTGDETPDEAAAIVHGAIGEVKDQRESERGPSSPNGGSSVASGADAYEFEDYEPSGVVNNGPNGGQVISGEDGFADLVEEAPAPGQSQPKPASVDDEVAKLMEGAENYRSDESCEQLPDDLREVVSALNVLASMDPKQAANLVTFDTRGVILPVGDAQVNMHKFRARVETSPWFLERTGE